MYGYFLTAALHYRHSNNGYNYIRTKENGKRWQTYATNRKYTQAPFSGKEKSANLIHKTSKPLMPALHQPTFPPPSLITLRSCPPFPSFKAMLEAMIQYSNIRGFSQSMTNRKVSNFLGLNYLSVFWRLRISCSLRRCWNRAKRAWRLTKPEAFRDNRKLSCAT